MAGRHLKRKRAPGAGRPAVLQTPVRFSLQMEQCSLRELSSRAARRRVTVSQLIREAIRDWLSRSSE